MAGKQAWGVVFTSHIWQQSPTGTLALDLSSVCLRCVNWFSLSCVHSFVNPYQQKIKTAFPCRLLVNWKTNLKEKKSVISGHIKDRQNPWWSLNCLLCSISIINIIMDSLRAEICQLSNFLSPGGHYSDEHTFIFSWIKTTLDSLYPVFSRCCNAVTKISTFANFMYQAVFLLLSA